MAGEGLADAAVVSTGSGSQQLQAGSGSARMVQEGPTDGSAGGTEDSTRHPFACWGDLEALQLGDQSPAEMAGEPARKGKTAAIDEDLEVTGRREYDWDKEAEADSQGEH